MQTSPNHFEPGLVHFWSGDSYFCMWFLLLGPQEMKISQVDKGETSRGRSPVQQYVLGEGNKDFSE